MNFYAYRGHAQLGQEPLGTEGKMIIHNESSERRAVKEAMEVFGEGNFTIYRYYNFYDDKTFRKVNLDHHHF